jgi:hypothetical protein
MEFSVRTQVPRICERAAHATVSKDDFDHSVLAWRGRLAARSSYVDSVGRGEPPIHRAMLEKNNAVSPPAPARRRHLWPTKR